ncbi:hypothetical protein TIFTF001_030242 [Ficus carica]|uniref:Putative plant transposon protein domain-containing protein n=1 Tax=Ficus carica TaxID=3494 RepID=A0AA88J4L9_FICCA|nr:hypothetical protein TIFTF001_030242 [Ficus carica]
MPPTKKLAHKNTGRKPKDTTTSYRTFQTEADHDRYEDFVHSVITKHKWRQFCAHPADAVVPVEPINDDTINQFYGLDDEDLHTEYAANASADWLDCALEKVCVAGTTWNVSTQGKLTVPRANLTPQCKVWYHFLKTRLMPSTHIQTVSKGCIILFDSIISGQPIDVGKIIFQELGAYVAKKCDSLWFPSLITSLC